MLKDYLYLSKIFVLYFSPHFLKMISQETHLEEDPELSCFQIFSSIIEQLNILIDSDMIPNEEQAVIYQGYVSIINMLVKKLNAETEQKILFALNIMDPE